MRRKLGELSPTSNAERSRNCCGLVALWSYWLVALWPYHYHTRGATIPCGESLGTLSTTRLSTYNDTMKPPRKRRRQNKTEPNTIRRTRFFDIYDESYPDLSLHRICKQDDIAIKSPTGQKWLEQRKTHGRAAYPRTRPQGAALGRPNTTCEEVLNDFLDSDDAAQDLHYQKQVEKKGLNVAPRTL